MNNIPWEEFLQRIDGASSSLSSAAQKGAEFVWPLAVRQQFTAGVTCIMFAILLIVIVVLLFKKVNCYREERVGKDYWTSETLEMWANGFFMTACIVSLIAVPVLYSGMMHLCNPEWYALQNMIKMLGL